MGGHIFPDKDGPFPSCPEPLFHNKAKCEAIDMKMIFILMQITVAVPDPQIGGGGAVIQTLRGAGLKTKFFSALRASFWPKNKGGPPLDPPVNKTCFHKKGFALSFIFKVRALELRNCLLQTLHNTL